MYVQVSRSLFPANLNGSIGNNAFYIRQITAEMQTCIAQLRRYKALQTDAVDANIAQLNGCNRRFDKVNGVLRGALIHLDEDGSYTCGIRSGDRHLLILYCLDSQDLRTGLRR